jgi:hypothetical protein
LIHHHCCSKNYLLESKNTGDIIVCVLYHIVGWNLTISTISFEGTPIVLTEIEFDQIEAKIFEDEMG